ncbi:MAG: hypothetical protein ACREPD_01775 [Stenotrophomonas sp.]|uniref:hypothetical protein n=1 Tax=Stenotrophomonas sp. TaxID=69392 RepID=UPI003D6D6DC3
MDPVDDEAVASHSLRIGLAVVAWVFCLPGLYFHVMIVGLALLPAMLSGEAQRPLEYLVVGLVILSPLSWLALGRMSFDWIMDRPSHWAWPVVGTALTLPILVPTYFTAAIFVLPGVVLALYLCIWHLWQARRRGDRQLGRPSPGQA